MTALQMKFRGVCVCGLDQFSFIIMDIRNTIYRFTSCRTQVSYIVPVSFICMYHFNFIPLRPFFFSFFLFSFFFLLFSLFPSSI